MIRRRPPVTVTLAEETISEIDRRRGVIPRSNYMEQIIVNYLNGTDIQIP